MKLIQLSLLILALHGFGKVAAQVQPGDELQELIRISEVYRTVPNLTFLLEISLRNTESQASPSEQTTYAYLLSEGRYALFMDGMDYVQGYNYNVAAYHEMHVIMVSKPRSVMNSVVDLPVLDSLFRANFVNRMTVSDLTDSTRKLAISYLPDTAAIYQLFYSSTTFLVDSIKYKGEGEMQLGVPVNQFITAKFKFYTPSPIANSIFDESKYVYSDGTRFFLKPEYSTYELMVNDNFSVEEQ